MAEQPLDKKILGVTHGFNQPSQQKPGIQMRLLTGGTKGNRKKMGQNKGRLLDILNLYRTGS